VKRIINGRHYFLPNDQAGRDALKALIWTGMPVLDVWKFAPWVMGAELQALRFSLPDREPTAADIRDLLKPTAAERERHRLRLIWPYNASISALKQQAKDARNERRRKKRRDFKGPYPGNREMRKASLIEVVSASPRKMTVNQIRAKLKYFPTWQGSRGDRRSAVSVRTFQREIAKLVADGSFGSEITRGRNGLPTLRVWSFCRRCDGHFVVVQRRHSKAEQYQRPNDDKSMVLTEVYHTHALAHSKDASAGHTPPPQPPPERAR
jgi:hypothetical protein